MLNKTKALVTTIVFSTAIVSCSMFGSSPEKTIAEPPKNLNNNQPILLPQPGNPTQQVISESAAAKESQSASRYKQINEDRGPGGEVNKVIVDNPGKMPSYYLYPQQQSDTNNNPDKLSTPNWQWSW